MANGKRKGCGRFLITALAGITGLCVLLAAVSAIANRALPSQSTVVDRLSPVDKNRLAEADHLRRSLGDNILPGWAQADIPIIVYNEENIFLTGVDEPAAGWQTVPHNKQLGAAWQVIEEDQFLGQPYYWQKIPSSGETTQAFTVRVGEYWAASLGTYEWMKIRMVLYLREDIPAPLQSIFPYGLVSGLFVPSSDAYASMILHEAAHAYQGIRAPERLATAELAGKQNEDLYPWENSTFQENWQAELDLLHKALKARSDEEIKQLARAFLDQRAERRAAAGLPDALVNYERQREWEEGIAKYAERMIYLRAADKNLYAPLPEIQQDPDFRHYKAAQQKWNQDLDQIRRMAGDRGDGRFYYSGFAQAVMLDRLYPGWKERLFNENVFLEDLLSEAVK